MDASYLPGLVSYLAKHSGVTQSLTIGVAIAVAVMVGLAVRLVLKTVLQPSNAALAAVDIMVWPLLLVVTLLVVERFRLLA